MYRIEGNNKYVRTGIGTLRYTPPEKTRGAHSKEITHDQKRSFIHPAEQIDIIVRETTGFQNVKKDRLVINSIEGILYVEIEDYRNPSSPLSLLS